ncbi:MAG TPA: fused MFS/spermidine synthase [Polyangiaceae bacterium]|nr:fused MFS/spermidine synthase [Polyangiaceae bacterium]
MHDHVPASGAVTPGPAGPQHLSPWMLDATAFVAGFGAMGAEMAAGRLLAPYYGTSTFVWCLLIGSVLSSLALGTYLGGRWSQRPGALALGYAALVGAGLQLAILPHLARPILRRAAAGFFGGHVLALALAGAAFALLLALPLVVLGALGPVLVQRGVDQRGAPGAVAGRFGAVGTFGSLLGTFVPGLILVPTVGTDRCFALCGASLVLAGVLGLRARNRIVGIGAAAVLLSGAAWGNARREDGATIYEAESRWGYLRVTEQSGLRRLYLNDGYAVQTVARLDGAPYLRGVWGYYALAPSFRRGGELQEVLVLGLGGGISARRYAEDHPRAQITAVELDPAVADVARRYFDLPASVEVAIGDGRSFVASSDRSYDLIVVDAFQFPYIPFQLATREFFELCRRHLRPGGAFVINVGRNGERRELVDAVAATLASTYRHVSGVNVPGSSNTILVGTEHPLSEAVGLAGLGAPAAATGELEQLPPVRSWPIEAGAPVLTDDRAPVELLTDRIILDVLWRSLEGARAWTLPPS